MDAYKFNEHYLSILNKNLLLEKNKEIILMGDFNINLLRYNEDHNSTDFLEQIYSCSLIPRITSPARLIPRSKTHINNILSTDTANEVIAGNILTTLSDHLAQFLLFPIKRKKQNLRQIITVVTLDYLILKYSYRLSTNQLAHSTQT